MFKKIKEWLERKNEATKRVSGLSKGMDMVDKYMRPGMNARALDYSAGYTQARIHGLYEKGEITADEQEAALLTLDNQHKKLRRKALLGLFA